MVKLPFEGVCCFLLQGRSLHVLVPRMLQGIMTAVITSCLYLFTQVMCLNELDCTLSSQLLKQLVTQIANSMDQSPS